MLLGRLLKDQRGGVAPMFALALIPLAAAVGSGVDYAIAAKVRTQLLAAADAASIGSVSKTSVALAAAATMTGDGAIPTAEADAAKIFNAHAGTPTTYTLGNVTTKVVKSGTSVSSVVEFSAQVPTHFMGLFGYKTVPVHGTSTAANSLPTFIDFYLLLDNTPSMGVAATPADVSTMVANTSDKCAFACHDLSESRQLLQACEEDRRHDAHRCAAHGDTAVDGHRQDDRGSVEPVPDGHLHVRRVGEERRADHDPGPHHEPVDRKDRGCRDRPDDDPVSELPVGHANQLRRRARPRSTTRIKKPGDGATSSSPQKYLFFVSDGVADRINGSPGCSQPVTNGSDPQTGKSYVRCQEPLDVDFCDTIKKRGIKIAVLYTTYLPLPTNAWYMKWIAPFADQIGKNMQSCASSGLYFEVSPTQGISEAMNALFQKAVAQARLTK